MSWDMHQNLELFLFFGGQFAEPFGCNLSCGIFYILVQDQGHTIPLRQAYPLQRQGTLSSRDDTAEKAVW